ncbi:VOC family protein [Herbaspirillum sp. NPDC101396]|uniref:VOC family protein n=1 Tax=Herbaspirillum sp. NPDC101396 TaxID=3364005 RepID=UPI00383B81AB
MAILAPTEIGMSCINIDELITFYVSAFSFSLVNKIVAPPVPAGGSLFCDAGYAVARLQAPFGERLKLLAPSNPTVHAPRSRAATNILREPRAAFLTFIVDDIDEASQLALECGAASLAAPVRIRPDLRIALLQDPEGNYIELAQYDDISLYRPDLASGPGRVS